VDLTGIAFTSGLDIAANTSGPIDLAPGARAVLVAKPSAFLHRYGSGMNVIGTFINGSNLSGSETLTLVDANGSTVTSFVYNAIATGPWPKAETSGTGASLILIQPELNPNPSLGINWRASSSNIPAPGIDDRPDLTAWQTSHFGGPTDLSADPDGDGLPNLFEFALGLDPKGSDDPARYPVFTLTGEPVNALVFTVRRLKLLETLIWQAQQTETLGSWSAVPGPVETLSTTDHGDGTETVTSRCVLTGTPAARYFRLRLTSP
jgi:hypothetical protein